MQVWNQDYRIGGQVRENVIYSLKIIRLYYMCNRYSLFFFFFFFGGGGGGVIDIYVFYKKLALNVV